MRVGLYCSDVSGAFDRVSRPRLLAKLRVAGVCDSSRQLLASWLDVRSAVVIVDGASSSRALLSNSVFQGTALGPALWNCFYADARRPVADCGFTEAVFAYDLNFSAASRGMPQTMKSLLN